MHACMKAGRLKVGIRCCVLTGLFIRPCQCFIVSSIRCGKNALIADDCIPNYYSLLPITVSIILVYQCVKISSCAG